MLVGISGHEDFITKHACWCRGGGALFWTFSAAIGFILMVSLALEIFSVVAKKALLHFMFNSTNCFICFGFLHLMKRLNKKILVVFIFV